MKRIIFLVFISSLVIFTSCKKKSTDPTPPGEISLEDTEFSSNFDWKTYTDFSVNISVYANSVVEIVSPEGAVYQKMFIKKNAPYVGSIAIPTYETSVRIIYLNQDVSVDLANGSITYNFTK